MKSEIIDELREAVDWQGIAEYRTAKGKIKETLTGIPGSRFWDVWKARKDEIKDLGLTVTAGKPEGTGESVQRRGVRRMTKRKQWEVILWINPRNRNLADRLQLVEEPF